jgi:integrase
LLKSLSSKEAGGLVFPGNKPTAKLSDMSLNSVMRRMGVAAVPHGLRASFRTWIGEETAHPREVAEMALAHVVANATEGSYWRGDLFEKRKAMMEDWAKYLSAKRSSK